MLTAFSVRQFWVRRERVPISHFLHGHHKMDPWVDYVVIQARQSSWTAEPSIEHGSGTRCRSGTTRYEETRVEGRHREEGRHEFAWFVAPFSVPVLVVVEGLSLLVKSSDSQREDWRLTDEEIIPQVQ